MSLESVLTAWTALDESALASVAEERAASP